MNEIVEKYLKRNYVIFGNHYVDAITFNNVSILEILNDLGQVFGSTRVESADFMLYWVANFEKNAESDKQIS